MKALVILDKTSTFHQFLLCSSSFIARGKALGTSLATGSLCCTMGMGSSSMSTCSHQSLFLHTHVEPCHSCWFQSHPASWEVDQDEGCCWCPPLSTTSQAKQFGGSWWCHGFGSCHLDNLACGKATTNIKQTPSGWDVPLLAGDAAILPLQRP